MARRFLAAAGGLLLAAGVGAFVAERAGWFDPAGWRDAVPGLGAPSTTPPETAAPAGSDAQSGDQTGDPYADQAASPPETAVVRPERKPAPDAVAPARKPTSDRPARDGTADGTPADGNDAQTAAAEPARDGADEASGRTASTGAPSSPSDRAETARTDAGAQPPADETDRAAPAGSGSDANQATGQTQAGTRPAEQAAGQAAAGPTETGEAPAPRDPDSGMQLTVPARDSAAEAPQGAEVAEVPARQLPSFDIVRVERSGEAVIAGRAAPRSRVTVLQDDQPIATAEADARGEFVAIPHRPLPPGQRQLTLRAEDPESGETSESDRAVVIDIPRMPDDDAAPAAAASRTAEANTSERGPQVATRGDSDADAHSDGDRQSGPSDTPGKQTAGPAGPETREDGGAGRAAKGDDTPDPVAARGQGEAFTVPAPPDAGTDDAAAPAATVTDVPEPAGGGAAATATSGETGDDAGARVTTRQEDTGAGAGGDRIATRAMRPRAAAPRQGGAGTRSDSAPVSTSDSAPDSATGGRGGAPIAVLVPREGTGEVEVLQRPSGETGLADRELVLEAVQYTVDGGVSLSGRAPARALVVAYLNESELARTRAAADGDWTMAPEADVPPGLHTLRVDQLGSEGQVRASVSTPFANQPMVDDLDEDEGMVVIQPGDNLWTIARRTYGQGWEYTLIYRANRDQIRDPDLIYPGQVFVVPEEQRRDTGSAE